MNLVQEIERRLSKYPNAKFETAESSIRVLPCDITGFEVTLYQQEDAFTVGFEGWHEAFNDPEDALECFAFAALQ